MFRFHSNSASNVNSSLPPLYDTVERAINTDNLELFKATISNFPSNFASQKNRQTIAQLVAKKQRWNMLAFLADTFSDPEGKLGFHDALTMVAEKSPGEWAESHTQVNQWELALTLAQKGPDHDEKHSLLPALHEAVRYDNSPDQPTINLLVEHLIYRGAPVSPYALATALSTGNLPTINLLLQASEADFALKKHPVILADGTSYESIETFLVQQNKQNNFILALNYNKSLASAGAPNANNRHNNTTATAHLQIFNRLLCRKNLDHTLTTKEIEQWSTPANKEILADHFKRVFSGLLTYDEKTNYIEKMKNSALAELFKKPRNPRLDKILSRNTTQTWSDIEGFCSQQLGVFYTKTIDMEIKTEDDDVDVVDLSLEEKTQTTSTQTEVNLSNYPTAPFTTSNTKLEQPEEDNLVYPFNGSSNLNIAPKGSTHTSIGSFINELYKTLENTPASNDDPYYQNLFERNQLELQSYMDEKIDNHQNDLQSIHERITYLKKLNGTLLGKYFQKFIWENISKLSEQLFNAWSLQAKSARDEHRKIQYLETAINCGINIAKKVVLINNNPRNIHDYLLDVIINTYNDHIREKQARNRQAANANANFNITSSVIAFSDEVHASHDSRLRVIHANWQMLKLFIETWPTNDATNIKELKAFQKRISNFRLDEYIKFYKNFDENISQIANSIQPLIKEKLARKLPDGVSSKANASRQFRVSHEQLITGKEQIVNTKVYENNTYHKRQ